MGLRLFSRLALAWLALSLLGVLTPVWLLALGLYLVWRRQSALSFARSLLSSLNVPIHKGVHHGPS